jgi:tetratricopeptide (TPR) repeat protein
MEGFEHEQLLNQLDAYRFLNDPNVLKWFAYRAIQRSDLEFFEKVFNEAKKLGSIPNHDLYVRLMKLYYKTNEFEKATKLFSEIQALGFPEDLKLKGMAILCYGKLGDFEMAKQIFLSVDTRVQARDIVLYGNLVSAALSCKEYESVQALVGQMSALGFEKTLPIYFSLIQIYCERGDLERISATIEELESNGHLLDRHHYSTIYLALLEHQHWNQARMFIQRCVEDGIYLPVKCIAATMEKLFDHGLSREWISAAGFHVTALKSLVFNKGVARNTV